MKTIKPASCDGHQRRVADLLDDAFSQVLRCRSSCSQTSYDSASIERPGTLTDSNLLDLHWRERYARIVRSIAWLKEPPDFDGHPQSQQHMGDTVFVDRSNASDPQSLWQGQSIFQEHQHEGA